MQWPIQLVHSVNSVPKPLETVEAIVLRDRGVTLGLYEFRSSGSTIGHGVRYMRSEDVTYSRADVMLVRWTPVG